MTSTTLRRILITGATRGLGRAMTEEFIRRGHTVFGCGRSTELIEELQTRYPTPHEFRRVDVSNDGEVEQWARDLLSRNDPPQILLNNAALLIPETPLWKVPAAAFSEIVDVNIKGVVNVIRHFVPAMVSRREGLIVNFSSGWGRSVDAGFAPYCATKWAIEGVSKALALELPQGMASIPLSPGIIDTEMLRSAFGDAAGNHPSASHWAETAVPFILKLSAKENGASIAIPG
jgi:NAD(P)-dependent dehydrogenase (short-subunit alcohol dehydrogenase family)